MHIANLYRYPIKGLSPERIDAVEIKANEGFPVDRQYALLRTDVSFDPAAPKWIAKANFIMLMLHEQLATLSTHYDEHHKSLKIKQSDGSSRTFKLDESKGREALEAFFYEFMPQQLTSKPRLLEAKDHHFCDKAPKYISLINLASLRQLEQEWGEELDPLRFRANVYIDEAQPFSELEWLGKAIQLGATSARVMQPNGRCAATNVNPVTGVRDRNIPGKLRAAFGHKDLGVYLSVVEGGLLREGDSVVVDASFDTPVQPVFTATNSGAETLICTACYYRFNPGLLNSSWHQVHDLPEDWRCRDCGATRDAVKLATMFLGG